MNRNRGNLNLALLPGLILGALAAGGWYLYYAEHSKILGLEKDIESVQRDIKSELEQQQVRIDKLTLKEQELLANLALEIEIQEQLRISFEQIKAEKIQLEASMQQQVNQVASTTTELEKELEKQQVQQSSLEQKLTAVSGEKSQLTMQLEVEQNRREHLQQQISEVSGNVGEKEKLLADAKQDVSQLNQQLETTRQEQNLLQDQIEDLNQQRVKDSAHFAELERRLGLELDENRVEIAQLKNQMTVIKLTDDVLFSSGSADIKPAGQKVLSLIAESLNAYPDRAISIEGHTDDEPTSPNSRYASNWELSASRALSAVNYFQQRSQVDPKRLKLVGYGEFRPAFSNDTDEGQGRNRRIEIILLPPEPGGQQ